MQVVQCLNSVWILFEFCLKLFEFYVCVFGHVEFWIQVKPRVSTSVWKGFLAQRWPFFTQIPQQFPKIIFVMILIFLIDSYWFLGWSCAFRAVTGESTRPHEVGHQLETGPLRWKWVAELRGTGCGSFFLAKRMERKTKKDKDWRILKNGKKR